MKEGWRGKISGVFIFHVDNPRAQVKLPADYGNGQEMRGMHGLFVCIIFYVTVFYVPVFSDSGSFNIDLMGSYIFPKFLVLQEIRDQEPLRLQRNYYFRLVL